MDDAGEAGRRIRSLGRRYAIAIRVITLVPISSVAVIAADGPMRQRVVLVVGALIVWSAIYLVLVGRGWTTWASVVDGAVLCSLGLLTAQLTPTSWIESGKTWIRPFVTFAAVGHQYSTPWRVGLPVGVAVCATAALSAGTAQGGGLGLDAVITVVWSSLIAVLARVLFSLLTSAAARADAAISDAASARQEQLVGASVRIEERLITDSLHDTAATTLLTVAVGQADGLEDLLRRRAQNDLDTLRAMRAGIRCGTVDLSHELRAAVSLNALAVEMLGPDRLDVRFDVARALADATGEALANVARHADASFTRVRFGLRGTSVFVEICDDGVGFDPGQVPDTRRGLRGSIVERVAAVGGDTEITSAAGRGTTVILTWSG